MPEASQALQAMSFSAKRAVGSKITYGAQPSTQYGEIGMYKSQTLGRRRQAFRFESLYHTLRRKPRLSQDDKYEDKEELRRSISHPTATSRTFSPKLILSSQSVSIGYAPNLQT